MQVRAGSSPAVAVAVAVAVADGCRIELRPRLVVGADGRTSTVRHQIGVELERHDATHMIAGLLVDGLLVD